MTTYKEVADRTETEIPAHLVAQADIPVVTSGQQGDVVIVPLDIQNPLAGEAHRLDKGGYNVVSGDIGRNQHILSSSSPKSRYHEGATIDDKRDFGVLTVAPDDTVVLSHTGEHGAIEFPEGVYRVTGQYDALTQARVAD